MTSRLSAAQHVVDDEQAPRVVAVGEHAGADRADDVEDADQGEVAGRGRRGDRVVVGGGHEVGLDQPVRRQPAHEEAAEQQPERAAAPGVAERAERGVDRPDVAARRGRRRTPRSRRTGAGPCPPGGRAGTARRSGTTAERADGDRHADPAPADALGQARQQRQEHELAARRRRGQRAGDEAAPGDEPAAGHGRGEHRRHAAGPDADDDAPQQEQLPRLGHPGRAEGAERDDDEGDDGDPAQPVARLQRGGERADEPEQQQVDADGGADRGPAPAELLAQRVDEDARRRAEAGGAEQRDERRGEDDPRVVEPTACAPPDGSDPQPVAPSARARRPVADVRRGAGGRGRRPRRARRRGSSTSNGNGSPPR